MDNLEQLFASLALSSASLVGKAAFSLATNVAIKKISSLVFSTSNEEEEDQVNSHLQNELSTLLSIVNPAIDFLETKSIHTQKNIQSISQEIKSKLDVLTLIEPDELVMEMKNVIAYIQEKIPYIQLSLCLAQCQSTPQKEFSLLKAMRASSLLSHPIQGRLGHPIPIRLYSLFLGSARKNSKFNWSWKEDYAQGYALFVKDPSSWNYKLYIIESLDDDLYHDEDEKQSKEHPILSGFPHGKSQCIPIERIHSFYYTSKGQILRLHDSKEPTFVVKTLSDQGRPEWLALEEYKFETSSKTKLENLYGKLNDLDYMIKLANLEFKLEKSHLNVDEETLYMFLSKDVTRSSLKECEL